MWFYIIVILLVESTAALVLQHCYTWGFRHNSNILRKSLHLFDTLNYVKLNPKESSETIHQVK